MSSLAALLHRHCLGPTPVLFTHLMGWRASTRIHLFFCFNLGHRDDVRHYCREKRYLGDTKKTTFSDNPCLWSLGEKTEICSRRRLLWIAFCLGITTECFVCEGSSMCQRNLICKDCSFLKSKILVLITCREQPFCEGNSAREV